MIHITPKILEAAYEFLRVGTPIFRKFPHGDSVEFHVTKHSGIDGLYSTWTDGSISISVSCKNVKCPKDVLIVTAHEMLHLLQDLNGFSLTHNAEFKKMAQRVCKLYGWDIKEFM